MNRYFHLRGWASFLAVVFFLGNNSNVFGLDPYLTWDPNTMSASESSDLGGYPAQNAFDSHYPPSAPWRGDWTFAEGSAQGDVGFSLRDDFHGSWHSLNDPNPKASPSGTLGREWLAADFGEVKEIFGVDIWNINWSVINLTRAVKNMSIDVSADGINWTQVWSGDLAAAPGNRPDLMYDGVTYINPTLGAGHPPQYGLLATDSIDFGGSVDAQYVAFNIQTNHGNDAYFCLEEIKFVVVPEPSSLLLSVFGLTFGLRRSRRR